MLNSKDFVAYINLKDVHAYTYEEMMSVFYKGQYEGLGDVGFYYITTLLRVQLKGFLRFGVTTEDTYDGKDCLGYGYFSSGGYEGEDLFKKSFIFKRVPLPHESLELFFEEYEHRVFCQIKRVANSPTSIDTSKRGGYELGRYVFKYGYLLKAVCHYYNLLGVIKDEDEIIQRKIDSFVDKYNTLRESLPLADIPPNSYVKDRIHKGVGLF